MSWAEAILIHRILGFWALKRSKLIAHLPRDASHLLRFARKPRVPRNPPVQGAEIVSDELQGGKSDMWRQGI